MSKTTRTSASEGLDADVREYMREKPGTLLWTRRFEVKSRRTQFQRYFERGDRSALLTKKQFGVWLVATFSGGEVETTQPLTTAYTLKGATIAAGAWLKDAQAIVAPPVAHVPRSDELFRLRMEQTRINDRLSTLKAEAEALLAQRAPIEKRIAELEDGRPAER
jgi:hypothetical protein